MLPFEDMVADYVKETGNHVMYRVTPIYKGRNLLASGVEMEGYSVEDKGEGIKFHVYCYNVQPDITIDYATGESSQNGKVAEKNTQSNSETNNSTKKSSDTQQSASKEYVLNLNTHKFHLASCRSVKTMSNANKGTYTGNRADLIEQGYEPCKICNP
jgi:DNA-entry nuclease